MHGTTTGEDVAKTFVNNFEERGIDIRKKIFSVTTDGAPLPWSRKQGRFVNVVEDQIGHPMVNFHCIMNQENLCAKVSNSELNRVTTTVVKIVNCLIAQSALMHRQFQPLFAGCRPTCCGSF